MKIAIIITNLIIPVAMVIAGYMMKNRPPKKINDITGYRTTSSKTNQETWNIAHQYCGKLWVIVGIIMMIISIIIQIPLKLENENTITIATLSMCTVQIIILLVTIIPVEMKLKKYINNTKKKEEKNGF